VSIPQLSPIPPRRATEANAVVATSGPHVAQARMKTYSVENILATWTGRRPRKTTDLLLQNALATWNEEDQRKQPISFEQLKAWFLSLIQGPKPMVRFRCMYCTARGPTTAQSRSGNPRTMSIILLQCDGCGCLHAPRPQGRLTAR
jgi:hypothetical protein